jgi:Transposase DDE domain
VAGIAEADLKGLRLIRSFNKTLRQVAKRRQRPGTGGPPLPRQQREYLSLYLYGLLNPVVRSMRALCRLSQTESAQTHMGSRAFGRSTFSEMQHLVEPVLLEDVFRELAGQAQNQQPVPPGQVPWRIVDSSVFNVLPRLAWAYFKEHNDKPQSAIRLHVSLDALSSVPVQAKITTAKVGERQVWKGLWQAGAGEVGDRNYSQDHGLLRLLERKGAWFILRLREKQAHVTVAEELPLGAADRAAGVTRQVWGHLGKSERTRSPRVRVLWIAMANGEQLMLVTNQGPEQMPADLVSLTYRNRWQVELFFRWLKCILRCRHFLAESPRGVAIQLYLALIAAVLLQLHLGRRPSLRMWEALQFYFLGLFTQKELAAALLREEGLSAARAAKKS